MNRSGPFGEMRTIDIGGNVLFLGLALIGLVATLPIAGCLKSSKEYEEATNQKAIEAGLVESLEWGRSRWVLPESND